MVMMSPVEMADQNEGALELIGNFESLLTKHQVEKALQKEVIEEIKGHMKQLQDKYEGKITDSFTALDNEIRKNQELEKQKKELEREKEDLTKQLAKVKKALEKEAKKSPKEEGAIVSSNVSS